MPVTNYYSVDGEIIGEKTTGSKRVDYLTDTLGSVVIFRVILVLTFRPSWST